MIVCLYAAISVYACWVLYRLNVHSMEWSHNIRYTDRTDALWYSVSIPYSFRTNSSILHSTRWLMGLKRVPICVCICFNGLVLAILADLRNNRSVSKALNSKNCCCFRWLQFCWRCIVVRAFLFFSFTYVYFGLYACPTTCMQTPIPNFMRIACQWII